MIVLNYETLTSSFGIDEEDLDDHLEVKTVLIAIMQNAIMI